jgi:hypothetical protein
MKITVLVVSIFCAICLSGFTPLQSSIVKGPGKNYGCTFTQLKGHRMGKGATSLTWSMGSNTGITAFDIECTYEDPYDPYSVWEPKGSVPNDNSQMFRFKDNNVLPGLMYYRITARLNNGTSVTSELCSVTIISRQ